jgi:hypothetical protein
MTGAQTRTSRGSVFKQSEIIPVPWQCILTLMSCIINNKDIFQIQQYTTLKQAMDTNFTHTKFPSVLFSKQYLQFNVFGSVHLCTVQWNDKLMQFLIVFIPYLIIYSTCFERHPLIIRSPLYCTYSHQLSVLLRACGTVLLQTTTNTSNKLRFMYDCMIL